MATVRHHRLLVLLAQFGFKQRIIVRKRVWLTLRKREPVFVAGSLLWAPFSGPPSHWRNLLLALITARDMRVLSVAQDVVSCDARGPVDTLVTVMIPLDL